VGRRIDADESLPAAPIPRSVLHELYRHALETIPEECCGLILGDERERFRRLLRCRNEMSRRHEEDPVRYPRDNTAAFYMNPQDYLDAMKQGEERGERVTAVYHSHVNEGAYLSEMDLEYLENELFPFPDADSIVASIVEGNPPIAALFRREEGKGFVGRRVEPAEA
jgi:adenylyltransferase/sulfurtransferase